MSFSEYLPQSSGWLPSWLLFTSTLAIGNCIQSYLTLHFTTQVYNGPASPSPPLSSPPRPKALNTTPSSTPTVQVTPLQSRTFGTWTLLSSLIRIYAAYKITNPQVYELALLSYVVAWAHFVSEWLWFGTAAWGRGLAGPVIVANLSLGWMVLGWGGYVG